MGQKTTGTIKPDWGIVLQDKGLIVSFECCWFKGMRKLTADDLGLEDAAQDERFKKLFQLGQKNLLPKRIFNKLHNNETRARARLVKCSFETPFGLFVPYAAIPSLEADWKELEKEFYETFDDLKLNLGKYKAEVLADYERVAAEIFTNGNKREQTARLLDAVRKLMPHKDDLRSYFKFDWQMFHISTPKEAVDLEKAAEGKTIKYKVNQKLAKEYEKKSATAIDRFIKDSIKKMLRTVSQLVNAALVSIKKNDGVLVPRLSKTLKDTVTAFQQMNCFGADEIEQKLVGLRALIADTDGDGPERGPKVKELLKDLKKDLGEHALFIRHGNREL